MSAQTVRSILRIVAVVTMLVGGIGVSTALISSIAIAQVLSSEGSNFQHSVTSAGLFGVLSWLAVLGWGAALYQMSPGIARHITSEPSAEGTHPKPVVRESASH